MIWVKNIHFEVFANFGRD